MDKKESTFFSTKFIRFLGGKNLLFGLIVLLLTACVIYMFERIDFIFYPVKVLVHVVVLPVILATIAYYLLRPILRLLEKWHIPRVWGILLLFIGAIGIITLCIVLVFPFLRDQFTNLANELPTYFKQLMAGINDIANNSRFSDYFKSLDFDLNKAVEEVTGNLGNSIKTAFTSMATGITSFISTITGIILAFATVPFILFYLLKDGEKLPAATVKLFPPRMRKGLRAALNDMDNQISSYIQGQIIVSMCIGIMVTIGFLIIGMDYALLLGVLAMVTSVVPYLGPIIAITPAAIIALVTSPFMILKLALVWTVVQLVEGKFISPQIMGKSLKIHPITIIFVLLTSGSLFGVPGVILGIPGYAVLKVAVTHLYALVKGRYNRYTSDPEDKYEI